MIKYNKNECTCIGVTEMILSGIHLYEYIFVINKQKN